MFRVDIIDQASYKIRNFVGFYFKVSLDLFADCWIENAWIIRKNYINKSYELKSEIYKDINKNLSLPVVLPKLKQINNYLSTVISSKWWNLFIYYTKDKKEKIRFIEDIEFNRR